MVIIEPDIVLDAEPDIILDVCGECDMFIFSDVMLFVDEPAIPIELDCS